MGGLWLLLRLCVLVIPHGSGMWPKGEATEMEAWVEMNFPLLRTFSMSTPHARQKALGLFGVTGAGGGQKGRGAHCPICAFSILYPVALKLPAGSALPQPQNQPQTGRKPTAREVPAGLLTPKAIHSAKPAGHVWVPRVSRPACLRAPKSLHPAFLGLLLG